MSIDTRVIQQIRKDRLKKLIYHLFPLGILMVLMSIPACALLKEQFAQWENTFSSLEECIEARRSLQNTETRCRLTLRWEIQDLSAEEPVESGELIF